MSSHPTTETAHEPQSDSVVPRADVQAEPPTDLTGLKRHELKAVAGGRMGQRPGWRMTVTANLHCAPAVTRCSATRGAR